MADKSRIEWTDATWNPITGCAPISEGCANCYAKREAEGRLRGKHGYPQDEPFRVVFHADKLEQPLKWSRPRKIFVCSMGDLFHEDVPDMSIVNVFAVMAEARQHKFLVLTKRPERMSEIISHPTIANDVWVKTSRGLGSESAVWPLPNVWLGVTAENQLRADERIPVLLQIPAAKRFVSVEPMLGPVDISPWDKCNACGKLRSSFDPDGVMGKPWNSMFCHMHYDPESSCEGSYAKSALDWVICGGETGANARPLHPDWVRGLRDQCREAQVPFFFKSWGEWVSTYDRDIDDPDWRNCPARNGPRKEWTSRHIERYVNSAGGQGFHGERVVFMRRIGKRNAGRLLDGRTWDEEPG